MAAAQQLHQKNYDVLLLEARDRIGGRVWSVNPWGSVLDLGASWLHGIDNNPVSKLIKQASIKTIPTSYNSEDLKRKLADMELYDDKGQKIPQKEIDATIPLLLHFEKFVNDLPDQETTLHTACELYIQKKQLQGRQLRIFKYQVISSYVYEFANDLDRLSIDVHKSYKPSQVSGKHVIFPKGYMQVADLLAQNIPIRLNQVVTRINSEHSLIEINTQNQNYFARAVIITIPVSLLHAKKIIFSPPLPAEKIAAFSQIKMGTYDKVFLYFKKLFWDKDKEWVGFIQSEPIRRPILDIMNYYKFSKLPILLAFNAGQQAERFEQMDDDHIINNIMQELRIMYCENIPEPSSYVITRWHNDPYALGSYSHLSPGVSIDNYQIISKPVNNLLFFAGEATSLTDPATVHGAYLSGIRVAREIEMAIKQPLSIQYTNNFILNSATSRP